MLYIRLSGLRHRNNVVSVWIFLFYFCGRYIMFIGLPAYLPDVQYLPNSKCKTTKKSLQELSTLDPKPQYFNIYQTQLN